MSPQERSQDFLSDAEWDTESCKNAILDAAEQGWDVLLDSADQPANPFAEAMWEMEKKKSRQQEERNTRHSVDKSQEFIDSGMTLITDPASDKYLNKTKKVSD